LVRGPKESERKKKNWPRGGRELKTHGERRESLEKVRITWWDSGDHKGRQESYGKRSKRGGKKALSL